MAITWSPYGSTALPTFGENDIRYNTQTQNPNWGMTENSPQFLGTNGWSLNNPYENTNMNDVWLQQNNVPDWFHNSTNVSWEGDQNTGPTLKFKTADKEGTTVPYKLVNGQWTPQMEQVGTKTWDTNSSEQNKWLAIMAAAMAGGAGVGMMSGAAPSGIGGLTSGMEMSSLGGGALPGAAASGGASIPWAGPIGMGEALGGGMFGIPATAAPAAAAAGSTIPSWLQSAGTKLAGSGLSSVLGSLTGGGGSNFVEKEGGGGNILDSILGKSGNMGLLDMLGAYYSSKSNEKLGDEYTKLWNQMQTNAAPFMQQLQQSYANPNSYWESPEYKALQGIEQNRIERQKAKAGTNSNPSDLAVLLQQHAAKNIDEYRKGLQTSVDSTQRQLAAFAPFMISGLQNSTGSLAPWFASASGMNTGAKSGGIDINSILKGVGNLLGTGESSPLPPSFDFGTRSQDGTFWAGEGLNDWDAITSLIDYGP